jgi:crotonobetainyl-CoA:carnitine CoA-transferase CaiB-like acyl-CoA transferase
LKVFKELDACVTPVLSIEEAKMEKSWEGYPSPSAMPQLLRTPPKSLASSPPIRPGQHSSVILKQLGYSGIEIQELCQKEVILDNRNASKL